MEDVLKKELILANVSDLVSAFMYYDRKEDEDLPRGAIEQAVKEGIISKEEIVEQFKSEVYEFLE